MENKLTILLNDKEFLTEIAKDPEVQLKIKDAIVDAAIKRSTKISNNLTESIGNRIGEYVKSSLLDPSGWSCKLKPEVVEMIKKESTRVVSDVVSKEVQELLAEVQRKLNYYKGLVIAKLEEVDVDKIIREEIRKAVDLKFK